MARGTCLVGTSGWSYPHWAKGRFYPRGLRQGEWLTYLATQFDTVEVNVSFYRLPSEALIAAWRAKTPTRFRMALKMWRRITHEKRLRGCDAEVRDFLAIGQLLGSRRGPLLIQLPPGLHRDDALLDAFLASLRGAMGRRRWEAAVEFRHASWLAPEVNALLDRHGVALVLSDHRSCEITEPNGVPLVYIRRHGTSGHCAGGYSDDELAADAARIRGWLGEGRTVCVYFNNDVGGHAVDNARTLRALLMGP